MKYNDDAKRLVLVLLENDDVDCVSGVLPVVIMITV